MASPVKSRPTPVATPAGYVDPDEYIEHHLSSTRTRIKLTEILTVSARLGVFICAFVLAFVIADQWLIPGGVGQIARILALCVLGLVTVTVLIWGIVWPYFKEVHALYAARMIEQADPTLKSSLLNLVDLQIHGLDAAPGIQNSMEKRAARQLEKIDLEKAIDQRTLMQVGYMLLGLVFITCLYVLLSPKDALSSVKRLLLPASETAVATQTSIANITPGDTKLLAGELLTVEADLLGLIPEEVTLQFSTMDREYVEQPVEMKRIEPGVPRYRAIISGEKGRGLTQNLTYRIVANDARSREHTVTVIQPPTSKVEAVSYVFPSYMRLEPRHHQGGHIEGWEGAQVTVSAVANMPLQSATVILTDTEDPQARGEEIKLQIKDGNKLSANWALGFRKDGTYARYYRIDCRTASGERDPRPTVYTLRIHPDQRPEVQLVFPTTDLERPLNGTVPLSIKANDPDFQLRFVTLRMEKEGEELHSQLLLDEERPQYAGALDLQLQSLPGLKPGDEIQYWIEARDNKHPIGNRTTTPRLKIVIAAPVKEEEAKQQFAQDQQEQQKAVEPPNNPDNDTEPQMPQAGDEQNPDNMPPENPEQKQPGKTRPQQPPPEQGMPRDEEDPQRQPNQPNQSEQTEPGENGTGGEQNTGRPQPGENPRNKPPRQNGERPMPGNQRQPGDPQERPEPGQPNQKPEGNDQQRDPSQPANQSDNGTSESPQQPGENQPGKGTRQQPGKQSQPEKADEQTALQKLIERAKQEQQEANPGDDQQPMNDPSNPDQPKDSQSKNNSATKPGNKPGSQRPGANPSERPQSDQPSQDDSQTNPKQPNQKPSNKGSENTDDNSTSNQQPGTKQPGKAGDKKSEDNKSDQPGMEPTGDQQEDQQPGGKQPGQTPRPNAGPKTKAPGNTPPGSEESQASDSETPKTGTNPMRKPNGEPQTENPDPTNPNADQPNAAESGMKPGAAQGTDPKQSNPMQKPGTQPDKQTTGQKNQPGAAERGNNSQTNPRNGNDPQTRPENTPANQPGNKPERTQPGQGTKPSSKEPGTGKNPKPMPGNSDDPNMTEPGEENPDPSNKTPDGMADSQDQRPGQPGNKNTQRPKQPPEQRPGQGKTPPNAEPGPGRPNQKSQKPDSGEQGGSTPQREGTPGSKEPGSGDMPQNQQPGQQAESEKPTGRPGDKPGNGSTKAPKPNGEKGQPGGEKGQPGGEKGQPGGEKGQPGGEKGQPGGEKGQPGGEKGQPGGEKGQPGGEKGQPGGEKGQPGAAKGQAGGKGTPSGQAPSGATGGSGLPGEGGGNGVPRVPASNAPPVDPEDVADDPNLDYARKASNLVLQKLKKDAERGEVDQELLDQLGWTKEDLGRFMQRLEKHLEAETPAETPEEIAQRAQFREMLKAIGLNERTEKRKFDPKKSNRVGEAGARTIPPPREFKELYEAYTRSLSAQKTPAAPAPAPAVPPKK